MVGWCTKITPWQFPLLVHKYSLVSLLSRSLLFLLQAFRLVFSDLISSLALYLPCSCLVFSLVYVLATLFNIYIFLFLLVSLVLAFPALS